MLLVAPVVLLILGSSPIRSSLPSDVSFTDQVIGNVGKWIGFGNFHYLAKNRHLLRSDLEHDRHRARGRMR